MWEGEEGPQSIRGAIERRRVVGEVDAYRVKRPHAVGPQLAGGGGDCAEEVVHADTPWRQFTAPVIGPHGQQGCRERERERETCCRGL